MEIIKNKQDSKLSLKLIGRLDTLTAPELESVVKTEIDGIDALDFDFGELDFVSSAGLRVLLAAQKIMKRQGSMVVRNVKSGVMEVFEITGFSNLLTIE